MSKIPFVQLAEEPVRRPSLSLSQSDAAIPAIMGSVPVALGVPAVLAVRTPTAAAAELLSLLRNPQSLRTAIVIHEVLGPPVSRRLRRGSRVG